MTFTLNADQCKKLNMWRLEQVNKQPTYDATGFRFQYIFTPSGFGDTVKVIDLQTKDELDLTEEF